MSIDKCSFCDYVTRIDWMRLFDESLDLSIEQEEVDYVAKLFTAQLLNSFDSTCNDIDYIKIKQLTPKVYCDGLTCVLKNIQIVPLQGGKLVLGLEAIVKPNLFSDRWRKCIFRGYWDGCEWHTTHNE